MYTEICIIANSAAAVDTLPAELARAKEQARMSNAAAEKASAKLKAGQAARHQYEEKISTMTLELKNKPEKVMRLPRKPLQS